MSDLVQWRRDEELHRSWHIGESDIQCAGCRVLLGEAAAAIESLTAERDELRAYLKDLMANVPDGGSVKGALARLAAAERVVEAARRVDHWADKEAEQHDPLRELRDALADYDKSQKAQSTK